MIDLHIHTTNSDGQYTTAEVLKMCEKAELELISITDHFSVGAYDDLKDPAVRKFFSGEILVGCEFPASFKGQTVEVLGYGFKPEDAKEYLSQYPTIAEMEHEEWEHQLQQYKDRGVLMDASLIGEGKTSFWNEINRHSENRMRYRNPQSAESAQAFFRKEMSDYRSPFFFDTSWHFPPIKEVVDYIHSLGGIAVLAHPLTYSDSVIEELEELIELAKPDGLEVWYSAYDDEQRAHLMTLCEKYRLIFSGGSDFHNDWRIAWGNALGIPHLAEKFPTEEILKWVNQCKMI